MSNYRKISKDKLIILLLFILSYCFGFIPICVPPFCFIYIALQIVVWYFIAKISVKKRIKCDFLCFYRIVVSLVGYLLFDIVSLEQSNDLIYLYVTQIVPPSSIFAIQLFLGINNILFINLAYDVIIVLTFFISKIILTKGKGGKNS